MWDLVSGECVQTIKAKAPVYAVAAAPGGKALAYAGRYAPGAESNFIYLCDLSGSPVGQYEWRSEQVVWERAPVTGAFEQVRRPVPRSIWSLAFSADGQHLAASCRELGGGNMLNGGGGCVWSMADPTRPRSLPDVYAVAFAPTGRQLAVTRQNAACFLSGPDVQEDGLQYRIPAMWSPAVTFVPGADLAVIGSNSFLYFVNPVERQRTTPVKTAIRVVTAVVADPGGRVVLAGGRPGTVEVYELASRSRTTTYDFGIGGVHGLAFAPDGLTFAAAGDKGLIVCDAPT